jgi:hypothetical protein
VQAKGHSGHRHVALANAAHRSNMKNKPTIGSSASQRIWGGIPQFHLHGRSLHRVSAASINITTVSIVSLKIATNIYFTIDASTVPS